MKMGKRDFMQKMIQLFDNFRSACFKLIFIIIYFYPPLCFLRVFTVKIEISVNDKKKLIFVYFSGLFIELSIICVDLF